MIIVKTRLRYGENDAHLGRYSQMVLHKTYMRVYVKTSLANILNVFSASLKVARPISSKYIFPEVGKTHAITKH